MLSKFESQSLAIKYGPEKEGRMYDDKYLCVTDDWFYCTTHTEKIMSSETLYKLSKKVVRKSCNLCGYI